MVCVGDQISDILSKVTHFEKWVTSQDQMAENEWQEKQSAGNLTQLPCPSVSQPAWTMSCHARKHPRTHNKNNNKAKWRWRDACRQVSGVPLACTQKTRTGSSTTKAATSGRAGRQAAWLAGWLAGCLPFRQPLAYFQFLHLSEPARVHVAFLHGIFLLRSPSPRRPLSPTATEEEDEEREGLRDEEDVHANLWWGRWWWGWWWWWWWCLGNKNRVPVSGGAAHAQWTAHLQARKANALV